MRNFPKSVNSEVIPRESPTVENALITSKNIGIKPICLSLYNKIKIKKLMVIKEISDSAVERTTKLPGIFRLNKRTSEFPLKVVVIDLINKAKVVVLIPPPVDPGDAPMNINKQIKYKVVGPSCDISTELKPAVLAVTDIKNECNNC